MDPAEFAEHVEAWRQIKSLEEIYAEAERQKALKYFWEKFPAWSPIMPAPTVPGPVTCEAADTSSGADAPPSPPGEGITYDCASAPMPDAAAKAQEAANRSAGAKAGFATRKRNLTEKLEDLRRRGVKLHEISAAQSGLSISDVMDALEAKPMSPMKIQALERAVRKLEEAESSD